MPAAIPRDPLRTEPARSIPAPRPQQERGAGWLSDLLARASRDEKAPPLPPRQIAPPPVAAPRPAASLDVNSLDIARMVEHEAAVAAWDRYRRGEQNAFGREIYSVQGQQTFDEIRRRYRSDGEFRTTVDRYTQEFERLLGEVGRDDQDGSLTRSYLTSETGKVYTMLGHAAGRFD